MTAQPDSMILKFQRYTVNPPYRGSVVTIATRVFVCVGLLDSPEYILREEKSKQLQYTAKGGEIKSRERNNRGYVRSKNLLH